MEGLIVIALFTSPITVPISMIGIVLLSLASRRWRTTVIPWGVVVLFPLALLNTLPQLLAASVIVFVLEVPGRMTLAIEVLATLLISYGAGALFHSTPLTLTVLPILLLLALCLGRLGRWVTRVHAPRVPSLWTEAAATVVLLGGATLCSMGIQTGQALPTIVGIAIPAVLPALLAGGFKEAHPPQLNETLFSALPRVIDSLESREDQTLDDLIHALHDLLQPLLGQTISVAAINPPFSGGGPTYGAFPVTQEARIRIRERLRWLFQSRKIEELTSPTLTVDGDGLLLHPAYRHQILVPVRGDARLVGILAFLGETPFTHGHQEVIQGMASAVEECLLHFIQDRSLRNRVASLERRFADQGRRLHHLLATSHAIYTAPDLRSVTNNLVEAARIGFELSWCALLLDVRGQGSYRLTARSGLPADTFPSGEMNGVPLDVLERLRSNGKAVSLCSIIQARQWPLEIPDETQEHLILLPVGSEDRPFAFLVLAPHPTKPMLELEEVKALETVVDQASSVIGAALHFEELHRQTLMDSLTGIANRRSLDTVMAKILDQRGSQPLSVSMIDVDDFKNVNDRYGHQIGDIVLRELAGILSRSLRARDFLARYGGEEFCALIPGLSAGRATLVLERVRRAVEKFAFASAELSNPLHVTISIGVSTSPDDGSDPQELIARSDEALYQAKRLGKNRIVSAGELSFLSAYGQDEPFF